MALILTVILILGSAAYLYFKGTIVRAFAMTISTIFASVAAFAYFEPLANTLIGRGTMAAGAYTFSFLLLFIVTFVIFLALSLQFTRWPVDFGFLPERIGRVVLGIISGFILSGAIIAALAMAPGSSKSPYQRFDSANPNVDKPSASLLNTDGFATGLFGLASRGSLSGERSFSALHPAFLNEVFLNRLAADVPVVTSPEALDIPNQAAIWPAPENLTDAAGKALPSKSGCRHMIVRIGIKQDASTGVFTFAQLRLVCKEKGQAQNPTTGSGTIIYPTGYLRTSDSVQTKRISDQIKLESSDFGGGVKWLDLVFDVPEHLTPVLAQFKQNNIVQLPAPVAADKAPLPQPFIPRSECTTGIAKLQPVQSAPVYGIELACDEKFLDGLSLQITDANQWQKSQTENSIKPAVFSEKRIEQVRAELLIKEPNVPQDKPKPAPKPTSKKAKAKKQAAFAPQSKKAKQAAAVTGITDIFKPAAGYKLLSLKCNNPAAGEDLKGEQLPVLVELSGLTHYPVGVIAAGTVDDQTIYEADYCSLPVTADSDAGCLTIGKNGAVDKPFPESVWLAGKAKSISAFYTLYLVKAGPSTIITSVKPGGASAGAKFEKFEGFVLK